MQCAEINMNTQMSEYQGTRSKDFGPVPT